VGCEAVSLIERFLIFWVITVPSSATVLDWFNLQDEGTIFLQNAGTHQLNNTVSHLEALNYHQCICYDSVQKVCKRGFHFELA
jgi:hypothetical protein